MTDNTFSDPEWQAYAQTRLKEAYAEYKSSKVIPDEDDINWVDVANGKSHNWVLVSTHVKWSFVLTYPNLPYNWSVFAMRDDVCLDVIDLKPDIDWNWAKILDIRIVLKYPDKPYDWVALSWECDWNVILENKRLPWFVDNLRYRRDITYEVVKRLDIEWDYEHLSKYPDWDLVLGRPTAAWNWEQLTRRASKEFILSHQLPWVYNTIRKRHKCRRFIKMNDMMIDNTFEQSNQHYWRYICENPNKKHNWRQLQKNVNYVVLRQYPCSSAWVHFDPDPERDQYLVAVRERDKLYIDDKNLVEVKCKYDVSTNPIRMLVLIPKVCLSKFVDGTLDVNDISVTSRSIERLCQFGMISLEMSNKFEMFRPYDEILQYVRTPVDQIVGDKWDINKLYEYGRFDDYDDRCVITSKYLHEIVDFPMSYIRRRYPKLVCKPVTDSMGFGDVKSLLKNKDVPFHALCQILPTMTLLGNICYLVRRDDISFSFILNNFSDKWKKYPLCKFLPCSVLFQLDITWNLRHAAWNPYIDEYLIEKNPNIFNGIRLKRKYNRLDAFKDMMGNRLPRSLVYMICDFVPMI